MNGRSARWLAVSALALGVVAPSWLARAAAPPAADVTALGLQPYDPPRSAPAFSLPDLEGRPRRLEDFHGKALMLFVWATW